VSAAICSACFATAVARRYSSSSCNSFPTVPLPLPSASEIRAASSPIRPPAAAIFFTSSLMSVISPFALSTVSPIDTTARCTVVLHLVDRLVDLGDGVAHLLHQVADLERLLAGDGRLRRRGRCLLGPGPDAEKTAADEPFGLDGRERVGPDQRVQLLGNLELHPEPAARSGGRNDLRDRPGLGAGHPDDGARLQAGDLLELGVDREFPGERHLAIADHEQGRR
jgi:hypothetical protein